MRQDRLPFWLPLAYLVFLVAGSLVPFDLQGLPAEPAWQAFVSQLAHAPAQPSLSDWVTNLLLYAPLALLTYAALPRRGWILGLLVWLGCVALSGLMEFAQVFSTQRTTLLHDIVANAVSAAAGLLLWPLTGRGLLVGYARWRERLAMPCWPAGETLRPWGLAALPFYGLALFWLAGWFDSPWLDGETAAARLNAEALLPLKRAYEANIAVAALSLTGAFLAYLPVGILTWALAGRAMAAGRLAGQAATWGMIAAAIFEGSRLFLAERQADTTNLLLAAAGAATGAVLACRLSGSTQDRRDAEPPPLKARREAPETELPPAPPSSWVRPQVRAGGALLALLGLGAVAAWWWYQPYARAWLAIGVLSYAALLTRYPHAWLVVLPAALPVLDLAPWSGRIFFDEFDALVLLTLAVGYALSGRPAAATWPTGMRWALIAWLGVVGISALVALWPYSALAEAAVDHYYSPYNFLRVAKGFLWATALTHLALIQRGSGVAVERLFTLGMVLGLAAGSLAVLWERAVFPGLFDFARDFRVAGLMSAMHTGGAYVEAHLLLTLPFLALWYAQKGGLVRGGLSITLLVAALYALAVTYARGAYAATLLLAIVLAMAWRRPSASPWRTTATALLGIVLVVTVLAPIVSGPFASARIARSLEDVGVRLDHWRQVLGMRTDDVWTKLFGMGPGRFPLTYYYLAPPENRPGAYAFAHEGERTVLRLTPGTPLYVLQRVATRHGERYRLSVELRGEDGSRLNVLLCERSFFDSFGCASATFEVTGQWLRREHVLTLNWPGGGGRPMWLALENAGAQGSLLVRSVALYDASGQDLVANGDFSGGAARWYFTVFDHLPWHIKNLWVDLLFSYGWLGLLVFHGLLAIGAWHTARCAWRAADRYCAASLAALAGFLGLGMVDSPFDAPRMSLLFMLVLTLGWARAVAGTRPTVAPALPPNPQTVRQDRLPRRKGRIDHGLIPLAGVWLTLTLGGYLLPHIPSLPYNLREVIYADSPLLSAGLLALAWLWLAALPVAFARAIDRHRSMRLALPALVLIHAFLTAVGLHLAVPSEGVHDLVGSPVLAWPGDVEVIARLTALLSAASVILLGGALLSRVLVVHRFDAGLLAWVVVAPPVLAIAHWVVVQQAATDNLTELMAGGGSWAASTAIALGGLSMALAGSLLGRYFAGRGLHGPATLGIVIAAVAIAYGFLWLGLAQAVDKYGQRFSALQFLLSTDRQHLAEGVELYLRYSLASLMGVLSLAITQWPLFRILASRPQASTNRAK